MIASVLSLRLAMCMCVGVDVARDMILHVRRLTDVHPATRQSNANKPILSIGCAQYIVASSLYRFTRDILVWRSINTADV